MYTIYVENAVKRIILPKGVKEVTVKIGNETIKVSSEDQIKRYEKMVNKKWKK